MDLQLERRQTPGPTSGWSESHRLDLFAPEPELALSLYVSARPHAKQATIVAVVLAPDAAPIVVADQEVPLPTRGWEFRTTGLWADHICETPHEHWSYGLEAFGLALEDKADLLNRGHGDRVPLGWELEFEAGAGPEMGATSSGYSQLGIAHGILLSADGRQDVMASARRWHWWGHEPVPSVRVPATVSGGQIGAGGGQSRVGGGQSRVGGGQGRVNEVLVPDGDGYWHHQLLADGAVAKWVPARASADCWR